MNRRIVCKKCENIYRIPKNSPGGVARCTTCGEPIFVPAATTDSFAEISREIDADRFEDHLVSGRRTTQLPAPPGLMVGAFGLTASSIVLASGLSLAFYKQSKKLQATIAVARTANNEAGQLRKVHEAEAVRMSMRLAEANTLLKAAKAESNKKKSEFEKVISINHSANPLDQAEENMENKSDQRRPLRIHEGINVVNIRYVQYLCIQNKKISIAMQDIKEEIRPYFKLLLLDSGGHLISELSLRWQGDSIPKGRPHVEVLDFDVEHGNPEFYIFDFSP